MRSLRFDYSAGVLESIGFLMNDRINLKMYIIIELKNNLKKQN